MQLLMSEGEEFGMHKGLDIMPGRVISLKTDAAADAGTNSLTSGGTACDRLQVPA